MPLPFRVPLSPHEQAIFTTLPTFHGSVVSPNYWPRHEQARGIREFLTWCEQHPRADWPQWLNDWHISYHLTKKVSAAGAAGGEGLVGAGVSAIPAGRD